jgi:hypothetical protein
VHRTRQTNSSAEGAADQGAFAGRGGRARGKGGSGARRLLKPEREKGEKKWGVRGRRPRGVRRRNERGAGSGGGQHVRLTMARLRRARAARHCSNRGASGPLTHGPLAGSGRERERRAMGHMGRPGEKGNGPRPKE